MNWLLWLGVAGALILVIAVLVDGLDDLFDALDLGPPWLSVPVVAAFVAAFGFGAGAVLDRVGFLAVVPGLLAGVACSWLAVRLSSAAMNMPTGRTGVATDLQGSLGRIVTPVTRGRTGEVLLDRPHGPLKVACRADGDLGVGSRVVVIDVESSTLVTVARFDIEGLSHHSGTEPAD